jgi:DNA-binding transcriptional ArsR family regulator
MADGDTGKVFKALADPGRRRLLDRLHAQDGLTLGALCTDMQMSRQAVTQHLAVLEAANLVVAVREGRERRHYLNPVPIQQIVQRWIGKFEHRRIDAVMALKAQLEGDQDG